MNPVLVSIVVCVLMWHTFFLQQLASAEGSLGDSIDCTDVSIDYTDDPTLTREERLQLMDKAFAESLNKFELCQSAKEKAKAAGGGGNGGTGGSGGNNSGGGSEEANNDPKDSGDGQTGTLTGETVAGSVASATMSGSESHRDVPSVEGLSGAEQGSLDMTEAGNKTNGDMTSANGKLPEDIPPASNDDALAAQIRYAAENEPDPVKSKQLWNEYRKYKGMTPKN